MTYQTYLDLADKVNAFPEIAREMPVFRTEMAGAEAADPSGFAALAAAVGAPELMKTEYPGDDMLLTEEQQEHNAQLAQELKQRLVEQGLEQHAAIWSVHCWMNALAWPFCGLEHGYDGVVEGLPAEEKEALAQRGDGFAAFSLARMYDEAGNSAQAARFYKAALDCCSLEAMRRIEYAAAESGMKPAGYAQLLARHASLGDPEGMAAYALHLIHADPQNNLEKALRLAYQSADLGSAAGAFTVYECLCGMEHGGYDVKVLAEDALEIAADLRHPKACLARALKLDAKGKYEDAYRELLLSVRSGRMYPGTWDGAHLIARCCLEGKGGAAKNAQQAYDWAKRGAEHGAMTALGMQGAMDMQGIGTQQELNAGAERIAAAAAGGDADSVLRMALLLRCGVNVDLEEHVVQQYADMVIVDKKESADGLGFAWISALSGMGRPQEAIQETVQEEPVQYEPEQEESVGTQLKEIPQADVQTDWTHMEVPEPELTPEDAEEDEAWLTPEVPNPNYNWEEFLQEEPVQQEPVQEAPVQEMPAQEEPEDEEEDEIYLLPEELERLKAEEAEEERQQAPAQMEPQTEEQPEPAQTQAYVQPEPAAPVLPVTEIPAQRGEFDPVEMQMPRTPSADGKPGLLLYCISSVWDCLDEEMIRMTGEPSSDEMLVDMLLCCLCSMLVAFEDDEQKKQIYHGVLAEFDRRMPDFAQIGYDRRYLDSRYRTLAQIMHESRMQLYEQAERDGVEYSWDAVCAMECSVMNGIIDMLMKPSEALAEALAYAVQAMFRDLTRELSGNE